MVVGRRFLLGDADPGSNERRLPTQSVPRRRSRSQFLLNRPQLVHSMVLVALLWRTTYEFARLGSHVKLWLPSGRREGRIEPDFLVSLLLQPGTFL